jgi:hypothetical protein
VTDTPLRVYGPQPLNGGLGETMYTTPQGTQKFFVRDITFCNTHTSALRVRASLGGISDPSKRVIDQDIAANSTSSIKPLWLLDAGETLQGLQVFSGTVPSTTVVSTYPIQSDADATSYAGPNFPAAADSLYILYQINGAASGTTALNPSSITDSQRTWTLVAQTTSTVASARNLGMSVWYYYSPVAGSSTSTTINFASTQHSNIMDMKVINNVSKGTSAIPPWTSSTTPVIQAVTAADSTAPASTNQSKTVTLGALSTGYVFYLVAKTVAHTYTAATGLTEILDFSVTDITGSLCAIGAEFSSITALPFSTTTIGPATASGASTDARVAIAWEMIPSGFVNCAVSGIEVR